VVVDDGSGSVRSLADPVAYRHQLVAKAAECLGRACTCKRCSVVYVSFDRTLVFGPRYLDKKGRKELAECLDKVPVTSSTLDSALAYAEELERTGTFQATTVVLSDFEIFDPPSARVYERLGALEQPLALVLRASPPAALDGHGIEVVEVNTASERTVVADALASVLAATRPPVRPKPAPPLASVTSLRRRGFSRTR
jgi:hypothetical protein